MSLGIAKYIIENPKESLEKLKLLCKGLDNDSKQVVYTMISRLINSYNTPHHMISDISHEELLELNKTKTLMDKSIATLHKNLYFYNGFYLPIHHFEIGVFWDKHGINKLHTNTLQDIKSKDIIDVGGFIGDSALILQDYTDKYIYSFEATSTNFALMQQTLDINNTDRIIPINCGLGSKEDILTISINSSGSSFLKQYQGDQVKLEKVTIITLDSYVEKHNINVGLIKVDIEGFELEFLKGALNTIKTQKPAMIISIYHQAGDFFDIKPFIESLALGYKFKIHKPLDFTVGIDTVLLCEIA